MVAEAGREQVDIVDENDRVVEVVERHRMRAERLRHRAVFLLVSSSDGALLVHRRSDLKDLWPGWWDVAVGGVVASGETYLEAARRELAEEIGVDDADLPLRPLGGGSYTDDDVSLIGQCFGVVWDGPLHFADGEVAEARFVTRDELVALQRQHRFLPDSLALLGHHIDQLWPPDSPATAEL